MIYYFEVYELGEYFISNRKLTLLCTTKKIFVKYNLFIYKTSNIQMQFTLSKYWVVLDSIDIHNI